MSSRLDPVYKGEDLSRLQLSLAAFLFTLAIASFGSVAEAQSCIGMCSGSGDSCAADPGCGGVMTCTGACAPPAAFPVDSEFTPVQCADPTAIPSQDPCDDQRRDHRNIIGGGTTPAYSFSQDGVFLYLRIRVEADPRQDVALRAFAWGFGLDADNDGEFEAYITAIGQGMADRVEVRDQDADNGGSTEFTLGSGGVANTALYPVLTDMSAASWVEVTDAGANFCADDSDMGDFFLTVAVPLTVLADLGALGSLVAYGGSSSAFTGIQNDIVCADGTQPCTLGSECPTGICLASGICAPPVPPIFTGCVAVDPDMDGIHAGCTMAEPICLVGGGTSICVECNGDSDCDDSNDCTADSCVSNACVFNAEPMGTTCTGGACDGDPTTPMCIACTDDASGAMVDTGCTMMDPVCDTSATPICVTCLDDMVGAADTGCSAMAPDCDTSGVSPVCVGCIVDADCDDSNECTADVCTAGACGLTPIAVGTMCTGGVCDGDASMPMCVTCADDAAGAMLDSGCMMVEPICDTTTTPTCVACLDDTVGGTDTGCGAAAPECDTTGAAPVCVGCLADGDCDDTNDCTTDACTAGACVSTPLSTGTMCTGGICDTGSAMCVACVDDAAGTMLDTGCAAGVPVCDTSGAAPVCVECVGDVDCSDGNECTTDVCTAGTCGSTSQAAGAMCSAGVCDGMATTPACIVCIDDAAGTLTDAGCTAGAPVCDSSSGSPMCTGCMNDVDCEDGNDCTTDTCMAGVCDRTPTTAGTICAGGVCSGDATAPMCLACVDDATGSDMDTGCSSASPLCDESGAAPVCVICLDGGAGVDAGCMDPTEVCLVSGASRACVDCEDTAPGTDMDFGCEAATPICGATAGGAVMCVECTIDSECPDMAMCNTAAGTCTMGCSTDAECGGTTPICQVTSGMCVECVEDGSCTGRQVCGTTGNQCEMPDTDEDGTPDDVDLDDDNDGIPDVDELGGMDRSADTDGDGVQDFEDPDSVTCDDMNADGVCDELVRDVDFDLDGVPNHLDLDADGDGLTDLREGGGPDTNGDGLVDGFVDMDGNGLDDGVMASPLPLPNTDGVAGPDFLDLDADGDGLTDVHEADGTDADGDGRSDGGDRDGNGLADSADPRSGGRALPGPDTDGDGTPDWQDLDSDGDTVPDATEGTDGDHDGRPDIVPSGNDADGDGIDDAFDPDAGGTSPSEPDTDGDGTVDWRDPDDDGDMIPTIDEDGNGDGDLTNDDEDGDGVIDYLDPRTVTTGGVSGGALCAVSAPGSDHGPTPFFLAGLVLALVIRRRR